MKKQFIKSQSIGNDFIIFEDLNNELHFTKEEIARLCDRHFGIGADGLMIARPSQKADFTMLFFNPDGSQAEMCGNGIRCFAKYLYDDCLTNKTKILIETLAGIREVSLSIDNDKAMEATVDMGEPVFKPSEIPVKLEGDEIINQSLEIEEERVKITCVSMGNPHCVIFVEEVVSAPVKTLGPLIENSAFFPKRTNVEFVQVINRNEIKMRVWERGAGETLACGTGACAAVVGGVKNELTERSVRVYLPGGNLNIKWLETNHVIMTGSAEEIFRGEINF